MIVLLSVIVALQCVMNALLYLFVRRWGAMTEAHRESIATQKESIDAQKELTASTNLVFASLIDAMATIARTQQKGGTLPPHPPEEKVS